MTDELLDVCVTKTKIKPDILKKVKNPSKRKSLIKILHHILMQKIISKRFRDKL